MVLISTILGTDKYVYMHTSKHHRLSNNTKSVLKQSGKSFNNCPFLSIFCHISPKKETKNLCPKENEHSGCDNECTPFNHSVTPNSQPLGEGACNVHFLTIRSANMPNSAKKKSKTS